MIQRIQTIFLLASLCFLVPMFFVPLADVVHDTGNIFTFNLIGFRQVGEGVDNVSHQYSVTAFGILICALNLIAIFMYKRRVLQMRLCVYNILLLIGLFGIMLFVMYGTDLIKPVSYRLPFIFPIVAAILHYLAFRGIRRDELMVQAMSRLR